RRHGMGRARGGAGMHRGGDSETQIESVSDEIRRAFYLEQFQDFLAIEQGSSPRTAEAYGRDLARLAVFAKVKGASSAQTTDVSLLRAYLYHLKDLGLAPASIRRNVSAIRTYFKFLLNEGHVARDPSERLD